MTHPIYLGGFLPPINYNIPITHVAETHPTGFCELQLSDERCDGFLWQIATAIRGVVIVRLCVDRTVPKLRWLRLC